MEEREYSADALKQMQRPDLKRICRVQGLHYSGAKSVLIGYCFTDIFEEISFPNLELAWMKESETVTDRGLSALLSVCTFFVDTT